MNVKEIRQLPIAIPSLDIQQKIAGILAAYDDLIENNLKRIKLLEEMAQITYEEWFVRLRFPSYESTLINPETDLPEGWQTGNINQVAKISWGDTSTTKSKYVKSGYVAFSASGPDGFLDYYDYDQAGVVLSAIGAYAGLTWLAAGKWSAIKNTMIFWPKPEAISVYYLYHATKSPGYWNRRGAAQPFIALGDARLQKVLIPAKDVWERFDTIAKPVYEEIVCLRDSNKLLEEARDILLPRLMTGVIDVESYDPAQLLKEAA